MATKGPMVTTSETERMNRRVRRFFKSLTSSADGSGSLVRMATKVYANSAFRLEPHVLEQFSRVPIEPSGFAALASLHREIAPRYECRGPVPRRLDPFEAPLGGAE
jgi:hypothetical protein